jgi:hypothetical protein
LLLAKMFSLNLMVMAEVKDIPRTLLVGEIVDT